MVLEVGVCASNFNDAIIISGLLIFILIIAFASAMVKNGALMIFTGIMLMIMSWYLAGCIGIFAYMIAVMGLVIIAWSVVQANTIPT